MSKRLILILSLALGMSLIATFAYAEVQNIKVGGDILFRGVSREAFTLRDAAWYSANSNSRAQNDYLMSTVRVRFDADLTDNVAATVRLLNEREWGSRDTTDNSEIDLDLAYVTLKEFLYSPLTLMVGRQELRFGNALIIGDPDTNVTDIENDTTITARDLSSRKAFDTIRATLDYSPWILDLIFAKIDRNTIYLADDITLYGMNACYDFGDPNNTIGEVYYFEKKDDSQAHKTDRVRTLGVHARSEPIENLTLNAEVAHQFGTYTASTAIYPNDTTYGARTAGLSDNRDAWAGQVGADYLFANVQNTPAVGLWYTYLSGEKDGAVSGDTYKGWDAMFEDQAGGTIYNAMLGASNCHLVNVKGSLRPTDDVTAALTYTRIILDKPYLNGATKILTGVAGYPTYTMTNRSHLGDEVDMVLTYDYTEDVQLGLNAGLFIPGTAFNDANDRNATQVIGSMKVIF